jgi:hypothetical protein
VRVGWQTIALYSADGELTHAARRLDNGRWTSKLGPDIDIEHDTLEFSAAVCTASPP